MIPERDTDDEVGGGEDHHSTAQTEVRVGQVLLIVLDGLYLQKRLNKAYKIQNCIILKFASTKLCNILIFKK